MPAEDPDQVSFATQLPADLQRRLRAASATTGRKIKQIVAEAVAEKVAAIEAAAGAA